VSPADHHRFAEELLAAACRPPNPAGVIRWEYLEQVVYLSRTDALAMAHVHATLARLDH
jgi:hypothetical protein